MAKREKNHDAKSAARFCAVQALYQMDIAGTSLEDIIVEYKNHRLGLVLEEFALPETDAVFFEEILRGVVEHQLLIDQRVKSVLRDDWKLSRLDSTLRAVLRAGTYEILCRDDVPLTVVTSQYTDMAHSFFDGAEAGMANALLNRLMEEKTADSAS